MSYLLSNQQYWKHSTGRPTRAVFESRPTLTFLI